MDEAAIAPKKETLDIAGVWRCEPVASLQGRLSDFDPIVLEPLQDEPQNRLYRELIGRYHYLGHKVAKLTKPGLYGDGGGLTLQITPTGAKSWLFRFMVAGQPFGM